MEQIILLNRQYYDLSSEILLHTNISTKQVFKKVITILDRKIRIQSPLTTNISHIIFLNLENRLFLTKIYPYYSTHLPAHIVSTYNHALAESAKGLISLIQPNASLYWFLIIELEY